MSRAELQTVLDFILNRASEAEFEVVKQACQRRNQDGGAFAALGASSSAVMTKGIAEGIEAQMGASLSSIRDTVRGFVADIIRKEAPEIPEEDLEALLTEYVPDPTTRREPEPQASPIPPEALLAMVRDFVDYSQGSMVPSRQRQLWEEMPRWQENYWARFPSDIRALVKAYLEARIDADTFSTALISILGL